MSEPSFVCFGAWMLWTLVRGLEAPEGSPWRRWGPVAFAVLLAVLLHHRPHVAAIVGATAAVSWALMGRQCLPWLVACAAAGLSRVPLYLRWDGLVTSDYQGLHGPGLSMPTLTYMLAAVLPVLGIFLLRAWTDPALRASRKWVAAVGGCGVLLALAAMPDLADRIAYDHPALGPKEQVNYAGIVGTAVRTITSTALLQSILLAIMAALGAASLAAAWIVAASHRVATAAGLVLRLSVLTLAIGLPMTAMTTGPAYDRYLQVWCILLPVAWVAALPRGLQVLQGVGLAVMLVFFVGRHLV